MSLSSCCLLVIVAAMTAAASSASFPPIWPHPRHFEAGNTTILISPQLALAAGSPTNKDLTSAFARFVDRTFPHRVGQVPSGAVTSVSVTIANMTAPLQLYVNESYELHVQSTGISISAVTVYGAYHALETLSQLTTFDFDSESYIVRMGPWRVVDAPRFPHRGILVDTSRHYLPVPTLKKIIDSLTYAKFNTLHWHIVDAISFPFDSKAYPKFGKLTSYGHGQRFTVHDTADIVEYARQRGIRVMIELDTPGHSAAMCRAYPEICPNPSCTSSNVNNWALDPTRNVTYDIVGGLIHELGAIFPELMMHLGGDEVDYWCWQQTPYIMAWLNERGLTPTGGYEYYVKRVQAIAWAAGKKVVGWQEIWDHFGTALNKKTIIHQWLPNSVTLPLNVTSHGYRLIWSDSGKWYLDHMDVQWNEMYDAEPCNGLPQENCDLILGGEACMWGETVDTSDWFQTVWPRAAAVAERLWTPRHIATTATKAIERIIDFRCLLNKRGVAAAPVQNVLARQPPPNPGSCYWQ